MSRRLVALLPLIGWLGLLVAWARVIGHIDGHDDIATMRVAAGEVRVATGNLGAPRLVRLTVVLLTVVATLTGGTAAVELAASGHDAVAAVAGLATVWVAGAGMAVDQTAVCHLSVCSAN